MEIPSVRSVARAVLLCDKTKKYSDNIPNCSMFVFSFLTLTMDGINSSLSNSRPNMHIKSGNQHDCVGVRDRCQQAVTLHHS